MIRKIIGVFTRKIICQINHINTKLYMRMYTNWLKRQGLKIADYCGDGYIDPTAWFDNYKKTEIGKSTTISREVAILTHDYSIRKGINVYLPEEKEKRYHFSENVKIGENCFIGLRSILLPGTIVEDNVIVGSGSVCKGILEANNVYAGVPAKKICTLKEFTDKHLEKKDYIV